MNIFTKIDVITKHQTNNPYKTFLYVFYFDEFIRTKVSNSERLFIQKCLNKNSPKQGKNIPQHIIPSMQSHGKANKRPTSTI